MPYKIKNGLFILLFAIILLPGIQQCLSIIKSGPLHGLFTVKPDVRFSWSGWWEGTYQDGKTRYINDNMGLRPDLIRANNQVDYSLFNKVHSEWRLLVGKDHCLYQDVYIYAYQGKDYLGYDSILHKMAMLKAVQDTLAKLGKSLIVVHSPCKAFFYPEDFPDDYSNVPKGPNNFETYLRICDSMGINQVDFNTWFVSMKKTSKELLMPKQGFHWSVYGSWLAADSLVKYMEHLRHIRMPHPVWTSVTHTEAARFTDDDIAKGLNLVFPVTKETFSYPEVTYVSDATTVKPKVLYIGDSFLFTWVYDYFLDNTNTDWQIWYYNRYLYDKTYRDDTILNWVPYETWVDELKTTDCIVLMYTSRNLSIFGNGFVEHAYDYYYHKK